MDYEELANFLINNLIDDKGVNYTIRFLVDAGLEPNDLILFFGFDGNDVAKVMSV